MQDLQLWRLVRGLVIQEVFDLIDKLMTTAAEELQIVLYLVRSLEEFHDGIVKEMQEDDGSSTARLSLGPLTPIAL
jgi:hypothetical protein